MVMAAHVRLCHSCMAVPQPQAVCSCYPRETQEMVFYAHDRAFALFKGTCGRGIYDNTRPPWRRSSLVEGVSKNPASCRCAAIISWTRSPARPRRAGRRARSRTRSGCLRALLHATAAVQNAGRVERLAAGQPSNPFIDGHHPGPGRPSR
jgi:hypothetical protein